MTAIAHRIERSPVLMTVASGAARKRLDIAHEVRQVLGLLLVMVLTVAGIVGLRALAFILGHEDMPLFREIGRILN